MMSLFENSSSVEDVAIVGMSGRFPQARNLSEFWHNLASDRECITSFSADNLRQLGVDPNVLADPNYVNAGLLLEDIDLFDAGFFGYNAREAEAMDPQHRVFLECAWHAFEDAGYDPQTCGARVGVFAGCAMSTYLFQLHRNPKFMQTVGFLQVLIGNDKDYLPTHTSYKLNLRGPSFSVQSACSTGLLATSLACRSLSSNECDMALAGASCIRVPEITGYGYQHIPGGIYSPDGHCRPFDAAANGTIFGNGVGVVLLKRYRDALTDGDHSYAVIKGSAVNNDGSRKIGYTAPGLDGQASVITLAQQQARVDPESVTFVESHGTGTPLGDPIEVAALTQAFNSKKRHFCAIGSVKSNIGHLDPAAGIASLIKTALALKNRAIPGSLHFHEPNPEIDFENSPFYVNKQLTPWDTDQLPRRAGVSAFGIGGTNVHVVLEEAPAVEQTASNRPAHLYLLSARSKKAFEGITETTLQFFKDHPQIDLPDAAFTSQIGRRPFAHRCAVVARSGSDVVAALSSGDPKQRITGTQRAQSNNVVFMFPGQGTQYCGMGQEVYQVESVFRTELNKCADLLKKPLGLDIREALFPNGRNAVAAADRLRQTAVAQPSLFAISYALAKLWMSWGIMPRTMIGHSIGEFVAACLAEVVSLDSALALISERGRLMQSMPSGLMLAVPLPELQVLSLLGDYNLDLAAVNEAGQCVVSGPSEEMQEFERFLATENIQAQRLHTSHAFHSVMMEPILEPFAAAVRAVKLNPPSIPFISNVTGEWITEAQATSPEYWSKQLRSTVRFADGLSCVLAKYNVLLEVGAGSTLCSLAMRQGEPRSSYVFQNSLPHHHETRSGYDQLLAALAHLWVAGVDVNWSGFHAQERRHRMSLPLYVFDRQRYWVESSEPPAKTIGQSAQTEKADIGDWFYLPSWETSVEQPPSTTNSRQWVLFEDSYGVARALAEALQSDGGKCILVRASAQFLQLSTWEYQIDSRNPDHYITLLGALRGAGFSPDHFVHLTGIVAADKDAFVPPTFDECQERGFYGVLYLTQALLKSRPDAACRITVVSSGVHAIEGNEQLWPGNATSIAACKCISQEYSNIKCCSIDIDLAYEHSVTDIVRSLRLELTSGAADPVVAYRSSGRWVQTFKPVRLEALQEPPALLRRRGVYLITGGLGNIGLAIAQWLAREQHARVVLIGRTALPPRADWQRVVASRGGLDPTSLKIHKLRRIEKLGGEFLTFACDVADQSAMSDVIKKVKRHFGTINGVFHAAGTVAPDAFSGVDEARPEVCERHFRPKVRGILALQEALKDERPDFWVLTSSLSSILAGLGFVSYAAANLFLDTYAEERRTSSIPWFSINWDAWEFEASKSVNRSVDVPMRPEEGIKTLRRILGAGRMTRVIVSTSNLRERLEKWIYRSKTENLEVPVTGSGALYARPDLATEFVAPEGTIQKKVAAVWCDLLGLAQVGVNDNFLTDLGGHSLLATQLASRLRRDFCLDIPVKMIFEFPTVAELTQAIESMECHSDYKIQELPLRRLPRETQLPSNSAPATNALITGTLE
jgi:acyl transferase domain-containing protein